MAREYNNKRSGRARHRATHQFLSLAVTFLLGYLTATVFDLETLTKWINTQVLASHGENRPIPKASAQRESAIPPKPKFEFYTLLTNDKVPVSGVKNKPVATQASSSVVSVPTLEVRKPVGAVAVTGQSKTITPAIKPPKESSFLVQVASFKARQDAEQMKGLLTLKGFSVFIVPVNHATKGNWFRVVVGPYANRNLAQKAQTDLARNEHLKGMITSG